MASFLSSLFTRNRGPIFPEENFAVGNGGIGGKPMIGSINLGYEGYKNKAHYPWCLRLSIALELEHVLEDGLPQPGEAEIANRLEDELVGEIKTLATAHYIAHLFNDTFLDIYVYLDNPEKVHDFLQTQINKEGLVRGIAYEITKDPKWENVSELLD